MRFGGKKIGVGCALVALGAWYFFLAGRLINLTNADLGRHLANGRWLLSDFSTFRRLLTTNFYSTTYPDFPFINHHWASGIVFYAVQKLAGFIGLSIFSVGLQLAAIGLMLFSAAKRYGWLAATGAALLAFPLVSCRAEVRPENFSYLFCVLFYVILSRPDRRFLYALPAILLFWVNLHIYFVFGFYILGCFILQDFLRARPLRPLFKVLGLCILATFVNPLGIRLLLVPLQIFQNYGYRIAENQSVPFFFRYGNAIVLLLPYLLLVPVLIPAGTFLAARLRKNLPPSDALLAATFLLMATLAIRNFPLLGLFSIPIVAAAAAEAVPLFKNAPAGFAGIAAALNLGYAGYLAPVLLPNAGLGIQEGIENSAHFFKELHIRGPIFNNFDIGGYLIYELYPDVRVFVDNRPEAYPASFFTDVYGPMQEDNARWKEESARYAFNAIFFNRRDLTPAAQAFLKSRVHDPEWVPIYLDPNVVIFVKNTDENRAIITRYQIPRP